MDGRWKYRWLNGLDPVGHTSHDAKKSEPNSARPTMDRVSADLIRWIVSCLDRDLGMQCRSDTARLTGLTR